jgi:hypothetical protein
MAYLLTRKDYFPIRHPFTGFDEVHLKVPHFSLKSSSMVIITKSKLPSIVFPCIQRLKHTEIPLLTYGGPIYFSFSHWQTF